MSRVAAVTGALIVGGAMAGCVVSVATLAVLGFVVDGPGGFPDVWDAFSAAAAVGAILGAVLAPVCGWPLLRRVPLGRAFGFTAVGATLGGALGLLLSALNPFAAIGGAVAGFAASVGWLRRESGRLAPVESATPVDGPRRRHPE